MFETLAHATKALDASALCAQGICFSVPKDFSGLSIADSAPHIATDGVYTADIVKQYRACSNDYTTIFSEYTKGRIHDPKSKDKEYVDTADGKLEKFRVCWETIDVAASYDVSPVFK